MHLSTQDWRSHCCMAREPQLCSARQNSHPDRPIATHLACHLPWVGPAAGCVWPAAQPPPPLPPCAHPAHCRADDPGGTPATAFTTPRRAVGRRSQQGHAPNLGCGVWCLLTLCTLHEAWAGCVGAAGAAHELSTELAEMQPTAKGAEDRPKPVAERGLCGVNPVRAGVGPANNAAGERGGVPVVEGSH